MVKVLRFNMKTLNPILHFFFTRLIITQVSSSATELLITSTPVQYIHLLFSDKMLQCTEFLYCSLHCCLMLCALQQKLLPRLAINDLCLIKTLNMWQIHNITENAN